MKKKTYKNIFCPLLIILALFFCSKEVVAETNYDGIGYDSTYTGSGKAGISDGGYGLKKANALMFTLVEVDSKLDYFIPKARGVMENTENTTYHGMFNNTLNWDDGTKNECSAGAVYGMLLEHGEYSLQCWDSGNFIDFDKEGIIFPEINKILPGASGFNFKESILKQEVLDSNEGVSAIYEKVVFRMLSSFESEINSKNFKDLTVDERGKLNKYRMIIEPLYAYKKNSTNEHIFMTNKGAAIKMLATGYNGSGNHLGIANMNDLYINALARQPISNILNTNGPYNTIEPTKPLDQIKALANVHDGAGYIIVNLFYPANNACYINKDENKLLEFTFCDITTSVNSLYKRWLW